MLSRGGSHYEIAAVISSKNFFYHLSAKYCNVCFLGGENHVTP